MAAPAVDQILTTLRTVSLLAHVPEAELAQIAPRLTVMTFAPGDDLVREGDVGDTCYFLARGEAGVISRDLIGQETTLAILGAGETIGEMALVVDGRRTATVRARGPLVAYALTRADFDYLAAMAPAFAHQVRHVVLRRLNHAFLRKASVFAELPDPAVLELADRLEPVRVEAGVVIVQEGDPGHRFFLIRRGKVRVTKGQTAVAELSEGDFFGETALLADVPRTATVRALSDCELLALDKTTFTEVVRQHASLQARFREMLRIRYHGAMRHQKLITPDPVTTVMPLLDGHRQRRYWRLLLGGAALFALLTTLAVFAGGGMLLYPTLIAGALVGPVVYVTYLAESQLLPERSERLTVIFLLAGMVGVPVAAILGQGIGADSGTLVGSLKTGLLEEILKVLPVFWFLRRWTSRFVMDGIVFGAAAGMGFAAWETALLGLGQLNSFSDLLTNLWLRTLLSPFTHGTWTALLAASLWRTRQGGGPWPAITTFATVVALHTLWDWKPVPGVAVLFWLVAVGIAGLFLLRLVVQRAIAEQAHAMHALSPEAEAAGSSASGVRCRQCGAAAPPAARYCARCGVALRRITVR